MRALGIDFGEKRIGLAISDPEARYALPWQVLERTTDRRAAYQIASLAQQEGIDLLVLGEPRHHGAIDPNSRCRSFGTKLQKASRLPVIFVDESLTTVAATDLLGAAGLDLEGVTDERGRRRARNEGRRDQTAAQLILQEALDRGLLSEGERDPK